MKKLIMVIVIAACLVLCAGMWPQAIPTEEVSITPQPPVVTDTQPETLGTLAIEELIAPEEEAVEIPPLEMPPDIVIEPDPTSDPTPVMPEAQAIDDPVSEGMPMDSEAQSTPEPQTTTAPTPSQTVTDPQPGDMVYVPGFGWLECQGPGEIIHDENLYENGNKIGVMG